MTMLTKIGNSQGVRIPKAIVQQAHLENVEIEFEVTENGLLLKPIHHRARQGWERKIQKALHVKDVQEQNDFVEVDLDIEDWEW